MYLYHIPNTFLRNPRDLFPAQELSYLLTSARQLLCFNRKSWPFVISSSDIPLLARRSSWDHGTSHISSWVHYDVLMKQCSSSTDCSKSLAPECKYCAFWEESHFHFRRRFCLHIYSNMSGTWSHPLVVTNRRGTCKASGRRSNVPKWNTENLQMRHPQTYWKSTEFRKATAITRKIKQTVARTTRIGRRSAVWCSSFLALARRLRFTTDCVERRLSDYIKLENCVRLPNAKSPRTRKPHIGRPIFRDVLPFLRPLRNSISWHSYVSSSRYFYFRLMTMNFGTRRWINFYLMRLHSKARDVQVFLSNRGLMSCMWDLSSNHWNVPYTIVPRN